MITRALLKTLENCLHLVCLHLVQVFEVPLTTALTSRLISFFLDLYFCGFESWILDLVLKTIVCLVRLTKSRLTSVTCEGNRLDFVFLVFIW